MLIQIREYNFNNKTSGGRRWIFTVRMRKIDKFKSDDDKWRLPVGGVKIQNGSSSDRGRIMRGIFLL